MQYLRVTTFGGLRLLSDDNKEVRFSTRKTVSLMVYLVMHSDRRHRREALCGLLWGNRAEVQARHSLSQALSEIRRVLGENLVHCDGSVAWVNAEKIWVDALELTRVAAEKAPSFEQIERLYRGDFLAYGELGEESFDGWLLSERERLRELAQRKLAIALATPENVQNTELRLATARAILAIDPYDEVAHRAVMEAYASQGHNSLVFDHYDRLTEKLRNELGIRPDRRTVAIYESLFQESRSKPMPGWSLDQYAFVLEQLPYPVVVTDTECNIVGWNAASQRETGFSKSEIYGRTPAVFLAPGADPGQPNEAIQCAIERGRWSKCIDVVHKNGQRGRQRRIVAPLFAAGGRLIGAFGHSHL